MAGTVVLRGAIIPIDRITLKGGEIIFHVRLPDAWTGDISGEEFRVHGTDGTLIVLGAMNPCDPLVAGSPKYLQLPIVVVDNRVTVD